MAVCALFEEVSMHDSSMTQFDKECIQYVYVQYEFFMNEEFIYLFPCEYTH